MYSEVFVVCFLPVLQAFLVFWSLIPLRPRPDAFRPFLFFPPVSSLFFFPSGEALLCCGAFSSHNNPGKCAPSPTGSLSSLLTVIFVFHVATRVFYPFFFFFE